MLGVLVQDRSKAAFVVDRQLVGAFGSDGADLIEAAVNLVSRRRISITELLDVEPSESALPPAREKACQTVT
ncbi:hypothetical protein [Nonomuraea longicatena]|uniref:Uncharacterized protein n=1 Tax=Nonomuraea longicatena TaxID=83682 RepID=A0ABN1R8V7_9ACTN